MSLPTERLDGNHAVVTGASRGLGRAAALALAEQGAMVTLIARSPGDLESVAAEIEDLGAVTQCVPADVTDASQVEAAIARATRQSPPPSILVTAAGGNRPGAASDYPLADWEHLMELNVLGTFLACRAIGRWWLEHSRRGRIVTLSSQMGSVGFPGRVAYCTTKHAVNGMTKALAVEWAPYGISVNAVAPTFVRTPMTASMLADPDFMAEVESRLPTGQLATVEDVAGAIAYLASDRAGNVTGHVLAVDGGWTAW